jgi:hypothetical protein
MTGYYKNSIEYHNDLDRYEARIRAEQEEIEIAEQIKFAVYLIARLDEIEGSDTSMASQLSDAGFGSGGVQ